MHHYNCDHLGTPMALTDQTGQVAWAAKLDPWGNVLQEYNPQGIHQAIRLPGQHHEGLYYNRHRYYDPVVGSYVNQDPIGLAGGVNKNIYVKNPNKGIDPLGLMEELSHIWNIGPWDALSTRSDNKDALSTAQRKFPRNELHNGKGDAFRHCYWSCIMSLRMGVDQAKSVGDTHEEYGTKAGQAKKEEIMDLHNNQKGRNCSLSSKTKNDCENKCQDSLDDGSLWFIDKDSGALTTSQDWQIP
ncbi:DUF6973 domain-containing protein [Delftia acidovorans]|uniref:DUF6973 domain-containing protein n=1 Tax=unclassified Delftia TaxID=2613839 RepID=UPI001D0CA523|nr:MULTISPECIES: RHS repeat-associated core domain-containing protein [Delftia]